MDPFEHDIDDVAAILLAYLRDHPEAGDTVDGMTHWWVHRFRLIRMREMVERACERLASEGALVRWTGSDGHVVYAAAARATTAVDEAE